MMVNSPLYPDDVDILAGALYAWCAERASNSEARKACPRLMSRSASMTPAIRHRINCWAPCTSTNFIEIHKRRSADENQRLNWKSIADCRAQLYT